MTTTYPVGKQAATPQTLCSVSIRKWIVKQHAKQKCLEGSTIRAMAKTKSPLFYFFLTINLLALMDLFGPKKNHWEQTCGYEPG